MLLGCLWKKGRPIRRPWEVCCNILFFLNCRKWGGLQIKFLNHSFDHITVLLKCPWWFPVPWGVLLSLALGSPPFQHCLYPLPLGTNHWLSQKFYIFSTAWGTLIIDICLAFSRLITLFMSLSAVSALTPSTPTPETSLILMSVLFIWINQWLTWFLP